MPPDLSSLTSSEQIFSAKHTLPQIRAIHSSLRAEIDDRSSRLRSQVGGSYRDLLGTADTIVQMRHDAGQVQGLLSRMGGRCGSSLVSVKAAGLASFVSGDDRDDAKTSTAVKQRLLDACLLLVGRILRRQGGLEEGVQRLVTATQVWVLGRLLINSLEEQGMAGMETPKKTVASLRRRLLSCVRRVLDKAESSDVLEPLCAYSLVTSSGARDVLRHFLSVRAEAITLAFAQEEEWPPKTADDVVRSLGLYTNTLLQVQDLVPAKMSPALAQLKSQPLLANAHLQRLEGLRLDVRQSWCGEELRLFTPFVRHDDLDGSQARIMLISWATQGRRVILEGLRKTLDHMTEPEAIVDLRTKVLQLWIREGGRAKGFDPTEMQDNMRHVINSRMQAVLDNKVSALRLIGSEVEHTLETWQEGVSDKLPGLWEEEGYESALAQGGVPFVEEVAKRLYGRSDAVTKTVDRYGSWMSVVDGVRKTLEQLTRQRWENDYDEVEDEETMEARQQDLSRDDPREFQDKLDTSIDTAFEELEARFGKLWDSKSEEANSGPKAMYMIRVLRHIRARLPDRQSVRGFGLKLVPSLHGSLVAHVSAAALQDFTTTYLTDRRVASRPLWEGEPALPTQPSAGVFRFLHTLCQSMARAGIDLWSATAVAVMKRHICGQIVGPWRREVDGLLGDETVEARDEDGKDETDDSDEDGDSDDESAKACDKTGHDEKDDPTKTIKTHDVAIQWLFDMSYLRSSLGKTLPEAKSLADEILAKTGLSDDEESRLRIDSSADDYWQRTNLLFGMLAL
ncbi:Conserved oligomeric Golgi complex subunit 1 [Ophiocordyceps camponoti-floridani]|uniref:Conserved oligomeric Golgi complex subunit 1 n=1 Tax=Ophiocordyceps camponoti-floridani TaxID=2030778 RepID=A0A8H4VEG8_9HYPO|nr:Conserved oligomeric Golgi complex subunit 1 [Ophiocordyceps camponoti-floridani]